MTGGRTESLLYPLYVNNLVTKAMNLCARIGVPKVNADVIAKL
jgi:type II secretory pathway predicted ATPase ExeA